MKVFAMVLLFFYLAMAADTIPIPPPERTDRTGYQPVEKPKTLDDAPPMPDEPQIDAPDMDNLSIKEPNAYTGENPPIIEEPRVQEPNLGDELAREPNIPKSFVAEPSVSEPVVQIPYVPNNLPEPVMGEPFIPEPKEPKR